MRLDKEKEKIDLGTITFGGGGTKAEVSGLHTGMNRDQVLAILGEPADPAANPLEYPDGAKTLKVFLDGTGNLLRITETLPGGAETIILQ